MVVALSLFHVFFFGSILDVLLEKVSQINVYSSTILVDRSTLTLTVSTQCTKKNKL